MLRFEWDESKALENVRKHQVAFEEATTVFADPLSITVADRQHSDIEERFIIIGESAERRLLVVVHTDANNIIRIISARMATRKEQREYEEV